MKLKKRRRRMLRSAARGPRGRRSGPPARSEGAEARVIVGGALDPAEKAADRAAAQAMAGARVTASAPATGAVHRKCAECAAEDEKKKEAKRSAAGAPAVAAGAKAGAAGSRASAAVRNMGAGKALAPADRAFFEPRFGRDFSTVRLHDGPAADRAARAIGARAFAWGGDIAFAAGERARGGGRLLGHELAHVAADGRAGAARRMLRRATIATADGAGQYKKVPEKQKPDVTRALGLVERAIKARRCRDFFRDSCSGGALDSATKTFDAATVYYLPDKTNRFGLSDIRKVAADPHVVAYNQKAFDIGRWEVAATLLHELFHTCDMSVDDMDEILAEKATEACGFYAPWITKASPDKVRVGDTITLKGFQFGQTQDADHRVEMGGVPITAYDTWAQPKGASAVTVAFKVPEGVMADPGVAKAVELVVVNHGTRSNAKSVTVEP